jgi:hypothetical protein
MTKILAHCLNPNCRSLFEYHNLVGGTTSAPIQFKNIRVGPCPNCGSSGQIQDGVYSLIDDVLTFIKNPSQSIGSLQEIERKIKELHSLNSSKDQIINQISELSSAFGKIAEKTPGIDYHKWISTITAILALIISIHQGYFKGNDDEIKNEIIEKVLDQNTQKDKLIKDILDRNTELSKENEVLKRRPNRKIGRNDLCPCGSKKKYKKCCLQ